MTCTPKTAFICRVVYSCSGIVIGLVAGAVFGAVFNNYPASILGFVSAILSVVCLLEFIFLYRVADGGLSVTSCSAPLVILVLFGIVGVAGIGLGVGAFIAFLGLGIIEVLDNDHINLPRSYFLGCVWAFVTFKWGLTAFFYSLKTFRRLYTSSGQFERLHDDQSDSTSNLTGGKPINTSTSSGVFA